MFFDFSFNDKNFNAHDVIDMCLMRRHKVDTYLFNASVQLSRTFWGNMKNFSLMVIVKLSNVLKLLEQILRLILEREGMRWNLGFD